LLTQCAQAGQLIQIFARTLTGKEIELGVKQGTTIAEVKEKIERKEPETFRLKPN
jgi:hypothetical protein